jgi:hypothetical protein
MPTILPIIREVGGAVTCIKAIAPSKTEANHKPSGFEQKTGTSLANNSVNSDKAIKKIPLSAGFFS